MKTLLAIIITLFLSSFSFAQDFQLKGEQYQIFQNVLKGNINKQMHERFWSLVPKNEMDSILQNRQAFDKFVNENVLLGYKYQQEFWKSLSVTFRERQIFKTDLYDKYKKILLTKPYSKQAIKNSDGMLLSASKRSVYNSPRGPIYPDDRMAEQVLINLDQMFARIKKLINPIWE